MPRTKPPDVRRNDLLDAAEEAFLERGIGATTVDEVVARAGVAKGTFYLYFRSRDELIAAVQRRFGEAFSAQLADAIAKADSWTEKIDSAVRACFHDFTHAKDLHDALFASVTKTENDEFVDTFADLVRTIRELLAAGVEAGAYRVDDVSTTALLLFNCMHGAFDAVWQADEYRDESRIVLATQTLFRRVLGLPDPEPART
ncbi:hypothetical protein CC117_28845 [Parafrankia colletiae]|uniref:HTH tetR-type domain-containing protein n=1 Tax=Parafrankia colletiae TaxID=573497 RepID=A0A1S1Q7V9_9ACTN|nr:TetR/AcrR family transcriptional regulator [Parafrankia colletiae]OHV29687.1 hypothetical protein CC117_28845 [Parafrankia colletiae]